MPNVFAAKYKYLLMLDVFINKQLLWMESLS